MSSSSIDSIHNPPRYRHSVSHIDTSSRHMSQSIGGVEGFDVNVNVKRAFSFEELQSGAYINAFDESDLQFYSMYGQPVLIPCSEDLSQGGWSLQGQSYIHPPTDSPSYSTTPAVHHTNPRAFQITKSYTLVGSLGDPSASTSALTPSGATHAARVPTVRRASENGLRCDTRLPQQSFVDHVYPSDFTSSPVKHPFDDEPPMDHLPYPPPTQPASSIDFQPYSPPALTHSPSPFSPLVGPSHRDASEIQMTVPPQSYMFVEPESSTPAFIHTNQQHYHSQHESPSHTHGENTSSPRPRSPSPRSALRTPPPHPKRSMDKKPALACLFCRGRKIACGPPVPGSKDRTCNQCARRHLKCEYPLESRRGMRKRRALVPRASGSPPPEPNPPGNKVTKSGRKRSVDKRP